MKQNEIKTSLERAAKQVSAILKSNFSGSKLRFCDPLNFYRSNFNGWFCPITSRSGNFPGFEIYLDFGTGHREPKFWYGFAANKKADIEKLIEISGLQISDKEIPGDDWEKTGHKRQLLLSKTDAELPIREFYRNERLFYIGVYVLDLDKKLDVPLQEITNFFSHVVCVGSDVRIVSEINSELEGFRGRVTKKLLQRATAIVREFLARMTAEGSLRCDLCGFDPEKKITGTSVRPRSLLDVHHKKPLSEGERYTSIKDLQLLCPTCHRFEHAKMRNK